MKRIMLSSLIVLGIIGAVGAGVMLATKPELPEDYVKPDIIEPDTSNVIETEVKEIKPSVSLLGLRDKYSEAKSLNPEVAGYVEIPSIKLSEPICKGSQDYYLNNNYKRQPDKAGAVFIDEKQGGFDRVNLLHGHNMKNEKVFGKLDALRTKGFMEKNDVVIHLFDGNTERTFKIISMFRTPPTISFRLNQINGEEVRKYAAELQEGAFYIGDEPTENDLLMLNTCYSDGTDDHMIVVAQEV